MIHFSHVRCDDCGERHTPGNPTECIEVLKGRVVDAERERDESLAAIDYEGAKAIAAQAQSVIDEKDRHIAALEADRKRLDWLESYPAWWQLQRITSTGTERFDLNVRTDGGYIRYSTRELRAVIDKHMRGVVRCDHKPMEPGVEVDRKTQSTGENKCEE